MTDFQNFLAENSRELGIFQYGFLPVEQLSFSEGVQNLCKMNYCGHYGKKWVCPPGVGTYEECRQRILQYNHVFVFTTKHDLEDSYDFDGMMAGKAEHNKVCEKVVEKFKTFYPDHILILAGDDCNLCSKCTYPDAPCRFPDKAHPSIESHGVEVNRLAATLGINYINGENTVTYFGCICFM
ncbi:MAG TPA: DUF2284 domain-containing protein [Candidatus Eubacterium avistercoris]|uniref:DUF2284 domain-containing protein n=1 Tax=Candidatus Eubacterium avistercoris TaxID=2838567 RepID=A0A9D2D137_9FIRM|nr:DUF2284 domain-containing protein [Candidatus Eubacterium avistercoris]